ncbi:MAG: hypothetical protein P8Z30_17105 [Acidobacteriota bacterium]
MRTATGVIATIVVLAGLAFVVRAALPSSPVFTIDWNAQQLYIPFNIAAFWACAMTGVVLTFFQMIRAMLQDVGRLR